MRVEFGQHWTQPNEGALHVPCGYLTAESPKRGGHAWGWVGTGIGEGMPVAINHAIVPEIPTVMSSTFSRFADVLDQSAVLKQAITEC